MSVTDLAIRAGFGNTGRGYISKVEHQQIKSLGEETLGEIARALGLSPSELRQGTLPAAREMPTASKETLDEAIAGCQAWLKLYARPDNDAERRLDCARTCFRLAELCRERMRLAPGREEGRTLLAEALQNIELALEFFGQEATDSFQKAHRLHLIIKREIFLRDLDDAIAGCQALLTISHPEAHPLDWARTQTRLAQLYWDRALQSELTEERHSFLEKALQSIDQALPLFRQPAPVSYIRVQKMREHIEAARKKTFPAPL
jgi:transcriptional regulator with XRE-family HTH domain